MSARQSKYPSWKNQHVNYSTSFKSFITWLFSFLLETKAIITPEEFDRHGTRPILWSYHLNNVGKAKMGARLCRYTLLQAVNSILRKKVTTCTFFAREFSLQPNGTRINTTKNVPLALKIIYTRVLDTVVMVIIVW